MQPTGDQLVTSSGHGSITNIITNNTIVIIVITNIITNNTTFIIVIPNIITFNTILLSSLLIILFFIIFTNIINRA